MKQSRLDFFAQLADDEKMNLSSHDFTVSEINEIIAETPLTEEDRQIAKLRYNECKTLEEIASITGRDLQTIKSRVPKISLKLKTTCVRMF